MRAEIPVSGRLRRSIACGGRLSSVPATGRLDDNGLPVAPSRLIGSRSHALIGYVCMQVTSRWRPEAGLYSTLTRRVMAFGRQRPRCYLYRVDGVLTRTRNKPSSTPDAADGGTRVRLTSMCSCVHVRVSWNRAGARTERRYCKPVGANSIN
jgi:hypothetical protein